MANRTGNYSAFYVKEPFKETNLGANTAHDFCYYNTLRMWKGQETSFPFVDSHNKTYNVRDDSSWETLQTRLRERLRASKNIVLFLSTDIRHIITSNIEHHAVLHSVESEKEYSKAEVFYLEADTKGLISANQLEKILARPRMAIATCESTLVSIMMANNEIGTIQPIRELAALTHEYGARFHTDAVQAVGHIPVDVNKLGVSLLSASAHKFNGPKGVGFLYSRGGISNLIDGGAQEMGARAGTENVAAIVGMATALKKNCLEMESNAKRIKCLENILINRLDASGLDYIRNGVNQLPGNMSLSFAGAEGEMLLHRLDLKKICVSTGSACDSVNTRLSHVIKAIEVPEKYAKGTIRISLGKENTEDEVRTIADSIIAIINT